MVTNLTYLGPCVKLGNSSDYCEMCAKVELTNHPEKKTTDVIQEYKGKEINKPVLYVKQSGLTKCFCMNCITKVYTEFCTDATKVEGE